VGRSSDCDGRVTLLKMREGGSSRKSLRPHDSWEAFPREFCCGGNEQVFCPPGEAFSHQLEAAWESRARV
jgi:hypothetical protein